MGQNGSRAALLRERSVQLLFEMLMPSDGKELNPVHDPEYVVRYPDVEKRLNKDPLEVLQLISQLEEAGVLKRKLTNKFAICPVCKSSNILLVPSCPFCKSLFLNKRTLIEHTACGNLAGEEAYRKDSLKICPKCNLELRTEGRDYKVVGSWFECENCKRRTDEPNVRLYCKNHKDYFTLKDVELRNAYSYVLTKEAEEEAKNFIALLPIVKFLETSGYLVESPKTIIGKSGTPHTFDLAATKENQRTVIDIFQSDKMVTEQSVIVLFAKMFDSDTPNAILIATPKLNESGKRLAEMYKIKLIESSNAEDTLKKLIDLLYPKARPDKTETAQA